MRGRSWTSERVDIVAELWASGETAAAIGVHLGGLSRSAVLGKDLSASARIPTDAPLNAPAKKPPAKNDQQVAGLARRRRRTRYKKRTSPCRRLVRAPAQDACSN